MKSADQNPRGGSRASCASCVYLGLSYGEDTTTLSEGDLLFLFTDGVTEAMNVEGEFYEEQRLVEVLSRDFASAESTVAETVADVWRFQGQADQFDDVTILVARFNGDGAVSATVTTPTDAG